MLNDNDTPPTIKDVDNALKELNDIKRPDGDNEGDAINSSSVYDFLSQDEQGRVDRAQKILNEYTRDEGEYGDKPKTRSLTELHKRGYPAQLNQDQYDPYRLVGSVEINEWELDISDPASVSD